MAADALAHLQAALADRYTLDRELGHGGNAVVYLAYDRKHDRKVALKVLSPELALSVRAERFLREIQIAAKLSHPHILPVHDSGEAAGCLYYVMPYVEGESLRDRFERGKQLPLAEALQIARDVAEALSYAHQHDVVHRDIKPENILLQAGHAVVADFGIARALTEASGQTVTATGIAVGTPVYMSPEQGAGSKTLDARSDVYSLGCVVYEMLAGRPPFTGETAQEILAHHVLDPVPRLRKLRPDVPPGVEAALLTALEKRPAERFATAIAFAEALAESAPARAGSLWRRARRTARRTKTWVYAGVGLGGLVAVGLVATRASLLPRGASAAAEQSVAVLPFRNLSGDSANAYLSDGMTEELINALARVPGLHVPARATSFIAAKGSADLGEIGRKLSVTKLVEGSVLRVGNRLRINAQLINVADGYVLWSEPFDRTTQDLFGVYDEISLAIVSALQVKHGPLAIAPRSTANDQAYDAYLRGRYSWNQRTKDGMRQATEYYEQAIALDPGYALAYTGLADAYLMRGQFAYLPRREAYPLAKAAALTAVARDSQLGEAYASLARIREYADWDWVGAEQAYRRGIALDPRYAIGHSWYGQLLVRIGRADEGLRETSLALALDPLNPVLKVNHAIALTAARRYAEAIDYYRDAIPQLPRWPLAHYFLGRTYLSTGQYREAVAELETARQLNPAELMNVGLLGYAYARAGKPAAARTILAELRSLPGADGVSNALGVLYLGLGDRKRALDALEEAVAQHDLVGLSWFGDSIWDPLRADPRFARLLANLGLTNLTK